MKLEKRKPSGREKDEASIKLLEQLREKLYSAGVSVRRRAAFNLSWMQEDGLDILKEALFSSFPVTTKNAAAYGLKSMRGRMKKMALAVFKQGLKHRDRNTREVCKKALFAIGAGTDGKSPSLGKAQAGKFEIREISREKGQKAKSTRKRAKEHFLPDEDFSQR